MITIPAECDTINMEGNKEEAKKCLHISRRYLAKGDKEKAKKFLSKSQKLFPLKEAERKYSTFFTCLIFQSVITGYILIMQSRTSE